MWLHECDFLADSSELVASMKEQCGYHSVTIYPGFQTILDPPLSVASDVIYDRPKVFFSLRYYSPRVEPLQKVVFP